MFVVDLEPAVASPHFFGTQDLELQPVIARPPLRTSLLTWFAAAAPRAVSHTTFVGSTAHRI